MRLNKLEKAEKLKDKGLATIMTALLVALLLITQLSYASDDITVSLIYDTNSSFLETDNAKDDQTNLVSPDFHYSFSEQPKYLPLLHAVHEPKSGFIGKYTPAYFIRAPPNYS